MLGLADVKLAQRSVWIIAIVVNLGLALPLILQTDFRWGIDYQAYIQQAGAVFNGERDYTKLSSMLGPCYYPAGHIWHYYVAFWLHMNTVYAELIIKAVHYLLHLVS